ncbi:hypothetical protein ACVWZX_000634 [Deinococcus sp. UYEF24]
MTYLVFRLQTLWEGIQKCNPVNGLYCWTGFHSIDMRYRAGF